MILRQINDQFRNDCSVLYQSKVDTNLSGIYNFVSYLLDTPKLTLVIPRTTIIIEETVNAIRLPLTGKAAAPDGFPFKFYRESSPTLVLLLKSVYDTSLAIWKLLQTC